MSFGCGRQRTTGCRSHGDEWMLVRHSYGTDGPVDYDVIRVVFGQPTANRQPARRPHLLGSFATESASTHAETRRAETASNPASAHIRPTFVHGAHAKPQTPKAETSEGRRTTLPRCRAGDSAWSSVSQAVRAEIATTRTIAASSHGGSVPGKSGHVSSLLSPRCLTLALDEPKTAGRRHTAHSSPARRQLPSQLIASAPRDLKHPARRYPSLRYPARRN